MKTLAVTALVMVPSATASANAPITPTGGLQRGTMVTVTGTVQRVTDEDEFILADTSGRVRVYVDLNRVPANRGESVTVDGFVDDDLFGPREIYARSLTREDGSVITFDRQRCRVGDSHLSRGTITAERRTPPRGWRRAGDALTGGVNAAEVSHPPQVLSSLPSRTAGLTVSRVISDIDGFNLYARHAHAMRADWN